MSKTPLQRILETLAAGENITAQRERVAGVCKVTRQAVEQWETYGIPGKHVFTLEDATERKVTAREMIEWSVRMRKSKQREEARA